MNFQRTQREDVGRPSKRPVRASSAANSSMARRRFAILSAALCLSWAAASQASELGSTASSIPVEDCPEARWIVEFAAPASGQAVEKRGLSVQSARQSLRPFFQRLEADLRAFSPSRTSATAPGASPRIIRRYQDCAAGAAICASSEAARQLAAQPYVAAVFPDAQVQALELNARSLFRIDEAIEAFGIRGEGIRIAIIDTGVDYNHPALGGGFGPGARVVGGYDFFNGDGDPMDDNGHGTAVAGIAASSDPIIRGVAPNCQLLALKVLSSAGMGQVSDVAAALEYALDPDQDLSTDDGAQVANLSLGTPGGNPDDFLSRAADNAVALGMVVCASAGNQGSEPGAIASPGSSRRAITAGSVNGDGQVSFFSSWGPTLNVYSIKPDLCAYGQFVWSLKPGGEAGIVGSGTSLACPAIAAAAALLRQLHPNWPPDWIKAALLNSAVDSGSPPPIQGAGRLDLLGAAQRQFLAEPPLISLGIDDLSQPVWSAAQDLKIHNVTTGTLLLSLGIAASLPEGIDASIVPDKLFLQPGGSGQALFEIRVDNQLVPNVLLAPYSYYGEVVIEGGATRSRVPFSFVSHPELRLFFDSPPWEFILLDASGALTYVEGSESVYARLLRPGIYDFAAHVQLPDASTGILLRKEFHHSGMNHLRITQEDVPHSYTIRAAGPDGEPLSLGLGFFRFSHVSRGKLIRFDSFALLDQPLRFSPLEADSKFEWRSDQFDDGRLVQLGGVLPDGIHSDQAVEFRPEDYRGFLVDYVIDLPNQPYSIGASMVAIDPEAQTVDSRSTYQARLYKVPPVQFPCFFIPPLPQQQFHYTQFNLHWLADADSVFSSSLIDTAAVPPLRVMPGSGAHVLEGLPDWRVTVGRGPFAFAGRFFNANNRQILHHWAGPNTHDILFAGPDGDFWRCPVLLQRFVGPGFSHLYSSEQRTNGENHEGESVSAGPFSNRLEISSQDLPWRGVLGGPSFASLDYYGSQQDPNPPYLRRMDILADGQPSLHLKPGGDNRVRLELADAEGQITEVRVVLDCGATSMTLPLGPALQTYGRSDSGMALAIDAIIPDLQFNGPCSLSILVRDNGNNVLRLEQPAAFYYKSENRARSWTAYDPVR